MSSTRPFVLAALSLAASLSAQNLTTIHAGKPGEMARNMGAHRRSLALAADGSMWTLIYGRAPGASDTTLSLLRSTDGGATWSVAGEAPTKQDGLGALVTGTDCDTLHVVWHARDGRPAASLYYQTFDVVKRTWNGSPTRLLTGTNSSNQFFAHDIEITPKGTIVVAFGVHRQPSIRGFNAWSGGILVKQAGRTSWSQPMRINVGLYGPNADLQAIGEVVHIAYRSNVGGYGAFYRAFDTVKMAFVQSKDVPVGPNNNQNLHASNVNHIAADDAGNLYVLYQTGNSGPGNGKVWVAYAKPPYTTWTQTLVYDDPPLKWGNNTYNSYSLATTPGLVAVVFSKAAENHQNLYYQLLKDGKKLGPAIPAAKSSEANRFHWVNGYRATQASTPLLATTSSPQTATQGGVVRLFRQGAPARAVRFGAACATNQAGPVQLDAQSLPLLGSTFSVRMSNLPATTPGALLVGTQCQRPPISLGILGSPQCFLYQDLPGVVSFTTGASGGSQTLGFQIQNNPAWRNARVYWQAALLHPAGVVTSNDLATALH